MSDRHYLRALALLRALGSLAPHADLRAVLAVLAATPDAAVPHTRFVTVARAVLAAPAPTQLELL